MQFGIREICDVVFKAKNAGKMGSFNYVAGQPVLYIDSAKTSTMEGAATTVYAQGGKGNARLIAWEGERTLTFTVEDALLSELGFAILSGAGLFNNTQTATPIYVHKTSVGVVGAGKVDLIDALDKGEKIAQNAPVFVMLMKHGSIVDTLTQITAGDYEVSGINGHDGESVLVDFYVEKTAGITEMTIDMENFAGYYYVEASTLFRRQSDGADLPAELIFPNVKIQSNFTFTMAATGDPSTFTFTMDAMPGYTRFKRDKKVLCALQVIDEDEANEAPYGDSTMTIADGEIEYPVEGEDIYSHINDEETIVDSASVKLCSQDGYSLIKTIKAVKGTMITLPELDTPTDTVTFEGWATTVNAADADVETVYEVTDNVTLYAVYNVTE